MLVNRLLGCVAYDCCCTKRLSAAQPCTHLYVAPGTSTATAMCVGVATLRFVSASRLAKTPSAGSATTASCWPACPGCGGADGGAAAVGAGAPLLLSLGRYLYTRGSRSRMYRLRRQRQTRTERTTGVVLTGWSVWQHSWFSTTTSCCCSPLTKELWLCAALRLAVNLLLAAGCRRREAERQQRHATTTSASSASNGGSWTASAHTSSQCAHEGTLLSGRHR